MRRLSSAGVLLGLGIPLLAACGPGDDEEPIVIQTAAAELRDLRITVEATGEVEPIRKVEVKSKAGGEILRLHVDTGDPVQPGSLLAEIDPRDVANAHDQAEADLAVAEARLEIAEAQLGRSQELLDAEVITAQEFESQKLEHANAQAALVRAQTNLELAELRLTDVTIRAPMSGTILEKNVEEGQVIQSASGNVSGGTTLFMMASLDQMKVRTLVDETDVGALRAGMSATVSVEAFPDREFQGEIEKVEPQAVVEQNVTMFPVIVLLENRQGLLKPGMNAEVEVLVSQRLGTLAVKNNTVVEPQELAPAAEVLGLNPEEYQIDRAAWGELMAQAREAAGMPSGGAMAMGGAGQRGDGPMAAIRAQVAAGEITQDSARALFAQMRQAQRGEAGEGPPAGGGGRLREGAGGAQGEPPGFARGGLGQAGAEGDEQAMRPGVAFVVAPTGEISVRPVIMGLNDWDYAEILAGLEEGEELAQIGAAQLQAQQQDRLNRMRGRMGGGPFR
ncbi:MAG: efflux RND transporter periplasmic adaptor subunit [Gemmatimonadetes bacterium]|nr:efflux RND transporter periplasmic adaptor subunit [Gemmatimonadota bacterium]